MHPVLPDQLPNFLRGLDGQLRAGSPPDITDRETLGFLVRIRLVNIESAFNFDIDSRMPEVRYYFFSHHTAYALLAELNIPYYPLLRRNVDCIIALDASADSQVMGKLKWTSFSLTPCSGSLVYTG